MLVYSIAVHLNKHYNIITLLIKYKQRWFSNIHLLCGIFRTRWSSLNAGQTIHLVVFGTFVMVLAPADTGLDTCEDDTWDLFSNNSPVYKKYIYYDLIWNSISLILVYGYPGGPFCRFINISFHTAWEPRWRILYEKETRPIKIGKKLVFKKKDGTKQIFN